MTIGSGTRRRHHPARGARTLAMVASATSTAGLAGWIAYAEGAFDADPFPGADGPATTTESVGTATTPAVETDPAPASPDVPTPDDRLLGDPYADAPVTDDPFPGDPYADDPVTDESDEVSVVYADGSYDGIAVPTGWGDVRVEVTIVDGAITEVVAVEAPVGRRSTAISSRAIPLLTADALVVQAAALDAVSGATYTSAAYEDSLQAALDAAALVASATGETGEPAPGST